MTAPRALADRIAPCGPVVDARAARRAHERLVDGSSEPDLIRRAWPALAPVFAASPYLAALARRWPATLRRVLEDDPESRRDALIGAAEACAADSDVDAGAAHLRTLKGELHLLTALADLGGVWDLTAVTGALSRFADAAVASAMVLAGREALAAGRITRLGEDDAGPLPGLFCIAMGKHGAFELNYSSDIDISFFHDPAALPLAAGVEAETFAPRLAERVAALLQARTAEGYVFRVDLRLRPDPSSTPVSVSVPQARDYYESVGQNWERAAFIKARVVAGDRPRGQAFLDDLQPFIWRRHLDFAAIADIHAIKRQIHIHKVDDRLTARGADLKLGRGGIREIEFYVQTQQLILGGRHGGLRSPRTLDTLAALAEAGQIVPAAAREMASAYESLRGWEHRIQMVADEQTHRLPEADGERRRIAALAGYDALPRFDAAVGRVLRGVNRRYGALFAGEEPLSSRFGSLIFTGVEDDPETLETLARMGFSSPEEVSRAIRAWHHGRINATRTERGREVFTRLAPRLLDAAQATGAPDAAFSRFADFFTTLSSGVQVQSLFLAQPRLFELVVRVMAFAPRFAQTLARRPDALDALLDPGFFAPTISTDGLAAAVAGAGGFEAAMDTARRVHREVAFQIGIQILGAAATAQSAGRAFADLADALIQGLARASLDEVARVAGPFPGQVAVIALGKCGSREMTAASDLDLMTLYRPSRPRAVSAIKGWSAETFHARFTQRLVAALSAPTAEGGLYAVDLQLRPSGTQGPVAVSFTAFQRYYLGEAETWELMAMTRARVVWASSKAFAAEASSAVEAALRRPRDPAATAADVRAMRALMARERPARGFWDMKLTEGGLVDIEFCAQYVQLIHAGQGGPLRQNTGEALDALAGLAPDETLAPLRQAWRLQQDLSQLLKVALDDDLDPAEEPLALRALLARTGDTRSFTRLTASLSRARREALAAYRQLLGSRRDGTSRAARSARPRRGKAPLTPRP
jgi:glutamate-ammonia-ligase adenylyltransferase